MAEAVVCFVAEGLEEFVSRNGEYLSEIRDQVQLALTELQLMRSFAKFVDRRQGDDVEARSWVSRIRDAAYDLEVIVETYSLKVVLRRKGVSQTAMKRYACMFIDRSRVRKIESKICDITNTISELRLSLQTNRIEVLIPNYLPPRDTEHHPHPIVGLEAKVEELVMHLVENEDPVIAIWGMGGTGKTTLAKEVYHHNAVRRHFDCFAWMCISEEFEVRRVLEEILVQFISPTNEHREEIASMDDDEIAGILFRLQGEKRCLVVIDDIWTNQAWSLLRLAFPPYDATGSKILLTTRNEEVAIYAARYGFIWHCNPLNWDESWELFENIAFSGRNDRGPEIFERMKELGVRMIRHCEGLPVAIVTLAGLLARKKTLDEWNRVYENIHRNYIEGYTSVHWMLAMSYDDLPYYLKPCFLYLGQFPEDFEIPAKELTQLWIAEGFISLAQQKQRLLATVEDVAYNCLSELVERRIVQVGKRGSVRKIKTCRMHDIMRELCLSKAREEDFLKIVNFSNIGHEPTGKVRRLALYFDGNDVELVSSRYESHDHVRSLLFFGPKNWIPKSTTYILSTFKDLKFLRVLKVEYMVREVRLPTEIGNMLCLKFLSLRKSNIIWLPPSLGNLICLQTLNLDFCHSNDRTPIIPNVIWKMEQLRHLYLPYYSSSSVLRLSNLCNLQTLSCVSSDFCDMSDLTKLTNLRKLGIRLSRPVQNLEELLRSASSTLNRIQSLFVKNDVGVNIQEEVMQIVLSCCRIYKLKLYGPIKELSTDPQHYPNLTKLSLCECHLEDDQMAILERLPNLRILSLQSLSFQESTKTLVCSSGGFLRLETLSLEDLETLEEWRIEEGAMPSLLQLGIHCCYILKTVPHGLIYITSLRDFTIGRMPRTFYSRLQEGGEDFYIVRRVPCLVLGDVHEE
ncbi:hypothetical protein L3X38_000372 [Prunus dulcis]|uniref:Disease resistance protein CC-NBS-LRR class family n=1 Tax=Prunus dulcis TaxID=3755 RepID=A0AAD4UQ64_PRUDU|nr:hypothetical protein L3X38_000372 [Prunus dulcis]